MTQLDRKITALAEEILKRPLSGEESLKSTEFPTQWE
jgi:hypothetical protein